MRNPFLSWFTIMIMMTSQAEIVAQRQLVLVNGGKVIHRFANGETFRTKWKHDKDEHWGFIIEVNEFNVVTSQDTIDISNIKQVLLPGKPLINKVGKTLIVVGIAYMFIDQINWVVVQGQDPSMDEVVWKPASILAGAGAPMLFFKKKWGRMKRGTHLVSVDAKSRLFNPDN